MVSMSSILKESNFDLRVAKLVKSFGKPENTESLDDFYYRAIPRLEIGDGFKVA